MAGLDQMYFREQGGGRTPPGYDQLGRPSSVPQFIEGDLNRPPTLQYASTRRRKDPGQIPDNGNGAGNDVDRYAGIGIGISGLLTQNLVSHPFVVLRRQCQVSSEAFRNHTTPFTLLPILVNINRSQGIGTLWKGIGSSLVIKGMTLAVEDCTSKFTPWPREIDSQSSLRNIGQHLMLKAFSFAVVTPFYSASVVETVQSEIASEKPGIFDVFREGGCRLLSWTTPQSGRMLPVWILIPPTVAYGLTHYVVTTIVKGVSLQILKATYKEQQKTKGAVSKDLGRLTGIAQYHDQLSTIIGSFFAEAILYPLETVLHRVHLQGTRTIIDNLDSGREVIPIITRYEGIIDCFSTIVEEEGVGGLFKGFGAMILQYAVHFAIIRFSKTVITEVTKLVQQQLAPPPKPEDLEATMSLEPSRVASGTATPRSFSSLPTQGYSGVMQNEFEKSSRPPSRTVSRSSSQERAFRKQQLFPSGDMAYRSAPTESPKRKIYPGSSDSEF